METTDLLNDGYDAIKEFFSETQYSTDCVNRYKSAFKRLRKFFYEQNVYTYSPDITKQFRRNVEKQAKSNQISQKMARYLMRISLMVDDFYQGDQIKLKYSYGKRFRYKISLQHEELLDEFIRWLKIAPNSLAGYRSVIREFLHYLENSNVTDLNSIDSLFISEYLINIAPMHKSSMNNVQVAIRKFIVFLKEKKLCTNSLEQILTYKTAPTRRKVYAALDDSTLQKLLSTPDRTTTMGIRDYAILILPSYTGVRAIDVANIKLQDIDRVNHEIHFIQHKTHKENILPLDVKVMAALDDYFKVRPDVDNPYVFQTLNKPYRKLNDMSSVRNILVKYMRLAGIEKQPWDGKGFQAFRRRIGVKLLESSTDIELISQILGHRNIKMLKRYLPLNIESMRCCALGLEIIPLDSEVYK
jgi:site-specific recombinase XerD